MPSDATAAFERSRNNYRIPNASEQYKRLLEMFVHVEREIAVSAHRVVRPMMATWLEMAPEKVPSRGLLLLAWPRHTDVWHAVRAAGVRMSWPWR